ncbi:MAG: hypothetical protein ABIZ91_07720, partial [Gemmatimonadaceae bacterium]
MRRAIAAAARGLMVQKSWQLRTLGGLSLHRAEPAPALAQQEPGATAALATAALAVASQRKAMALLAILAAAGA